MVRERMLPTGWYPATESEVRAQCRAWADEGTERRFVSAVVPHAGWFFSGSLAFRTLSAMLPAPDTVVVAGGHLGPSDPVMIAPEDQLSTPLGLLTVDRELSDRLKRALRAIDDRHPDNTVEIQLPFVAYLFPSASVVYVRVPPSPDAIHLGETLAQYARSTGRQIRVIGSTDLTHYGPNYGFVEHGRGAKAVEWVRDANDAPLIETMLSMNDVGAISQALRDRSACSPGAAATAIAFARESGCVRGEEVDYYTSYSIQPAESFVGYAGIGFAA